MQMDIKFRSRMKSKYDLFISYRRFGFETASLIATTLKSKGYRVFFDIESLRSGKFNEQLFRVIDECRDFLVVLPEGALDRCVDEEDWVRKEVCHAMSAGKNIIPVMLSGFAWPNTMPSGMEELKNYQAVTASSHEYFDLAMDRLCIYLKSKPVRKVRQFSKIVGIISGGIVSIFVVLYLISHIFSIPVCLEYADGMAERLARLDEVAYLNDKLLDDWELYRDKIGKGQTYTFKNNVQSDFLDDLQNIRKQVQEITPPDTAKLEISNLRALLLSLRGIDANELSNEPVCAYGLFQDLNDYIDKVESMAIAGDLSQTSSSFLRMNHDVSHHMLEGMYYSYLELFALMPDKAVHHLRELESMFKSFPTYANLKLTKEEYLAKQNEAISSGQRIQDRLSGAIERDQQELDALESQLDDLEKRADAELSQRYFSVLKECQLGPGDGMALQWTKIVRLASFMEILASNQDPEFNHTSVTPISVYGDLSKLIDSFIGMDASRRQWAETSRFFYKDVCLRKRPLSGAIIFSINGDGPHPVHQEGDIVISMKGTPVSNYESLFEAYKKDGPATTVFLRLESGKLVEHKVDDCGDISSFLFANL